eukprot:15442451-Alexandrium_andersonii.AAC.1
MLKPAVLELGARFRAARGLHRRAVLPEVHAVGTTVMHEAMLAAQGEHVLMVRRVAMDGLWTAHRTVQVSREDKQCPWCGAACEDALHVLWDCPTCDPTRDSVLQDHRRL